MGNSESLSTNRNYSKLRKSRVKEASSIVVENTESGDSPEGSGFQRMNSVVIENPPKLTFEQRKLIVRSWAIIDNQIAQVRRLFLMKAYFA